MSDFSVGDHVKIKIDSTSQAGRQKTVGPFAGNSGKIKAKAAGWITVNIDGKEVKFRKTEMVFSRKGTPSGSPKKTPSPVAKWSPGTRRVKVIEERTKTNAGTLGKTGTIKGRKGTNNMYKVEIDGKEHSFYPKNLDFIEGTRTPSGKKASPKKPAGSSPDSVKAAEIADEIVSKIRADLKDRVLKIICRRTSGVRAKRSPNARAARRRSTEKACQAGYERLTPGGRCVRECAPGQSRNDKNRCVKKKSSPKGRRSSPKKPSPVAEVFADESSSDDDDEDILEGMTSSPASVHSTHSTHSRRSPKVEVTEQEVDDLFTA